MDTKDVVTVLAERFTQLQDAGFSREEAFVLTRDLYAVIASDAVPTSRIPDMHLAVQGDVACAEAVAAQIVDALGAEMRRHREAVA